MLTSDFPSPKTNDVSGAGAASLQPEIEVGLFTGGIDKPYASGLARALIANGIRLDFIGSDEVDGPELHTTDKLKFLNLRGNQRAGVSIGTKVSRILSYYARLIGYAVSAKPRIFHILWNNKFDFFDRTFLTLYYKLLGKKIVFTAHNVNAGKRDSKNTLFNRIGLKIQYELVDHIFVHTDAMKDELLQDFGISANKITVIPFGINDAVPHTNLTPAEAKRRLGIRDGEKTMLFFGRIKAYKGLEYLVDAFQELAAKQKDYRLIIAGNPKRGSEKYFDEVQRKIHSDAHEDRIIQKLQYIPDEDTEMYFKAADVVVLPYTGIFQSGVLFLGYSFGLPVIATDVGSLGEEIIEGQTGHVCKPCDSGALARTIETYFDSDLYKTLDRKRQHIQAFAHERHSWEVVSQMTRNVYAELTEKRLSRESSRAAT